MQFLSSRNYRQPWCRKWRHFNASSVSVLLSDMCTSNPQGVERRVVIRWYSNTRNVYSMLACGDYVFVQSGFDNCVVFRARIGYLLGLPGVC